MSKTTYELGAKTNQSYEARAKTNQERAVARYSGEFPASKTPWSDPLLREAEKNPRGQVPDDVSIDAPPRQLTIGGDGSLKVKR